MIELAEIRAECAVSPEAEAQLATQRAAAIALWEHVTGGLWQTRTAYPKSYRYPCAPLYVPLLALSALVVDVRDDSADDWETLVADTDYELETTDEIAVAAKVHPEDPWPKHVRLTMTGGYTSATCPVDVKDALAKQIAFALRRWQGARVAQESETNGDNSTTFLRSPAGNGVLYGQSVVHPVFAQTAGRRQVFIP